MTKRTYKRVKLILFGIILLLLIPIIGYLFIASNIDQRAVRKYTFKDEVIVIDTTKQNIQRGAHLIEIKGCTDCHGKDLSGKVFLNETGLGLISASNLTKGKGGLASDYGVKEWVLALKHGVNKDGKPLLFMPSHETALLSKQDINAIISYCERIKNVDRVLPESKIGPLVKILTYYDKMPLLPVEMIDHEKPMILQAEKNVGIAQGAYLAVSCRGCHRDNMDGGDPLVPGMPSVPSITKRGNLKNWNAEEFRIALKTGKTPSGHQMKNDEMPWKMTGKYTDDEIQSLYLYLKSL